MVVGVPSRPVTLKDWLSRYMLQSREVGSGDGIALVVANIVRSPISQPQIGIAIVGVFTKLTVYFLGLERSAQKLFEAVTASRLAFLNEGKSMIIGDKLPFKN